MDDIDFSSIMVGQEESAPVTILPSPIPSPVGRSFQDKDIPVPPAAKKERKDIPAEDDEAMTDDKRSAMITRIRLLLDTFSAKLKDIKPKKPLDKLTDDQLAELNKNIEYVMGAKTNVEAMAKTFPLMLKAVEELTAQFTPLRIQGTHAICFEPDVQDMIKYTIIDSGIAGIHSTPQQRLAFTLISAAMSRHAINSAMESMTAEQKQAMAKAMNPAQPPTVSQPKPSVPKGTSFQDDDKYADL